MKRSLLTLVFTLLICLTTIAQSKTEVKAEKRTKESIEKIETITKLSDDEKAKYSELQKAFLIKHFAIVKEFKESDPEMFKTKVKENNFALVAQLKESFGNKRAMEILKARRKK